MTILNKKMLYLFRELNWEEKKLDEELLKVVSAGFVRVDGCFLLENLCGIQKHMKRSDFGDNVSFECFVNSLQVDDYVVTNHVVQGILLIDEVFRIWGESDSLNLVGIISQTEFGANVKFHLYRPNEKWIDESEIENFDEPILISQS